MKLEALNNRELKQGEIHEGDSVMSFYGVDMNWYPAKVLRVMNPHLYYIIYDVFVFNKKYIFIYYIYSTIQTNINIYINKIYCFLLEKYFFVIWTLLSY